MIAAIRTALITIMLLASTAAHPEEDRGWHLLTQANSGAVSLLKDLTKRECEFAANRLLGLPATDGEREAMRQQDEARKAARDEHRRAYPECYLSDQVLNLTQCVFLFPSGIVSHSDTKTAECFR